MKVVLFCGGRGLRIGAAAGPVPKPMVKIGYRPVLWHLMKYYAHYGHTEFILCLGHGADAIKRYFRDYDETVSNDFVVHPDGSIELLSRDMNDWTVTLVDTGRQANVGERLRAVSQYLGNDEMFLANYADGLTDAPLDEMIERLKASGHAGSLLAVRPRASYHLLALDGGGMVSDVTLIRDADLWINGGFFVFRREIFDFIKEGEDLVPDPLRRAAQQQKLVAYRYDGFWASMDTLKEKQMLEDLHASGEAPWEVWRRCRGRS